MLDSYWADLYERAAFAPRAELVEALDRLDHYTRTGAYTGLRGIWVELGFATRWPGRKAAIDRIRRRILDRHDTYVRVQL